jgi:hypothetical protein
MLNQVGKETKIKIHFRSHGSNKIAAKHHGRLKMKNIQCTMKNILGPRFIFPVESNKLLKVKVVFLLSIGTFCSYNVATLHFGQRHHCHFTLWAGTSLPLYTFGNDITLHFTLLAATSLPLYTNALILKKKLFKKTQCIIIKCQLVAQGRTCSTIPSRINPDLSTRFFCYLLRR